MSNYAAVCLVLLGAAVCNSVFTASFVWKVLLPHRNHNIFRARRFPVVVFALIGSALASMLRPIIAFLRINSLDFTSYKFMIDYTFSTSFTILVVRMYFLWYDLNYYRLEQTSLITKYLFKSDSSNVNYNHDHNTDDHVSINSLKNYGVCGCCAFLFKLNCFFGSSLKLTSSVFVISFATVTIQLLFHVFWPWLKEDVVLFIQLAIFVMLAIFLYCVATIWLCPLRTLRHKYAANSNNTPTNPEIAIANKVGIQSSETSAMYSDSRQPTHDITNDPNSLKFRDLFNIRYELTGIWSVFMILASIQIFMVRTYDAQTLDVSEIKVHILLTAEAALGVIANAAPMLFTVLVPYFTLKRINRINVEDNRKNLTQILMFQNSFTSFAAHLSQEFSLENLSFLIELWQLKNWEHVNNSSAFVIGDGVTALNLIRRLSSNFSPTKQSSVANTPASAPAAASNPSSQPTSASTLELQLTLATASSNRSDSGTIEPSQHTRKRSKMVLKQLNGVTAKRARQLASHLEHMPWDHMPLANGIKNKYSNCKWHFAVHLFNKYVSKSGYDSINISSMAFSVVEADIRRLDKYYRNREESKVDGAGVQIKLSGGSAESRLIESSMDTIENDQQFEEALGSVFDRAVLDVWSNLHDSLSRYKMQTMP